jgi:hypothetical protein
MDETLSANIGRDKENSVKVCDSSSSANRFILIYYSFVLLYNLYISPHLNKKSRIRTPECYYETMKDKLFLPKLL